MRRPRPLPWSSPVISWSQADMAQASSADHIHTLLTVVFPDGRWRRAAPCLASLSASMSVRCRYQCSTSATFSGVDTSRFVRMKEYPQT